MINPYKIKELTGLIIPQFLTVIVTLIVTIMYGLMMGSIFAMLSMVVGYVVGKAIIKNPFSTMLKGEGLLTIPLDSTGVLKPFICTYKKGFLENIEKGIKAPFDRAVVHNFNPPENKSDSDIVRDKDTDDLYMKISKDKFNASRFSMNQYPVLLWNDQIQSFITKDWLSEKESKTFSRHQIIHANKMVQELVRDIRNFGRYIADNATKRFANIFANPIMQYAIWIIIIGLIGFLLVKFGPQLMGGVGDALNPGGAVGGNTVTPNK